MDGKLIGFGEILCRIESEFAGRKRDGLADACHIQGRFWKVFIPGASFLELYRRGGWTYSEIPDDQHIIRVKI